MCKRLFASLLSAFWLFSLAACNGAGVSAYRETVAGDPRTVIKAAQQHVQRILTVPVPPFTEIDESCSLRWEEEAALSMWWPPNWFTVCEVVIELKTSPLRDFTPDTSFLVLSDTELRVWRRTRGTHAEEDASWVEHLAAEPEDYRLPVYRCVQQYMRDNSQSAFASAGANSQGAQ